jgi:hypothetical protein
MKQFTSVIKLEKPYFVIEGKRYEKVFEILLNEKFEMTEPEPAEDSADGYFVSLSTKNNRKRRVYLKEVR